MRITITDDEGEVFVIHEVDQQTAAYLGHLIEPHSCPAPVPETSRRMSARRRFSTTS